MNQVIPQPGHGRHPVGLVVVVALHAALAVVLLLNSRLRVPVPPPKEPIVDILPDKRVPLPPPPIDESRWIQPKSTSLDRPQVIDPPPVERVADDNPHPVEPARTVDEGVAGGRGGTEVAIAGPLVPPHLARRAVIDARSPACQPDYPPLASRAAAQGVSRIRFTVDAAGQVVRAETLQSAGSTREHRLLDRAAADALQRCPITVGMDDAGRPMGTTVDVEYVWSLQ